MYAWERLLMRFDFFQVGISVSVEAFHFLKKRGLIDSESFKEYFHTILKMLLAELKYPHK
jgi:hypothetical protein